MNYLQSSPRFPPHPLTGKGLGVATVCDNESLIGVITDGDLPRKLDGLLGNRAGEICTRDPKTVSPEALASQAMRIMNDNGITSLCVVNERQSGWDGSSP